MKKIDLKNNLAQQIYCAISILILIGMFLTVLKLSFFGLALLITSVVALFLFGFFSMVYLETDNDF